MFILLLPKKEFFFFRIPWVLRITLSILINGSLVYIIHIHFLAYTGFERYLYSFHEECFDV